MSRRHLLPEPGGSGSAFAPRGHIDGLILSNDTDTDHDISVSEGEATLSDGSGNRIVAENTGGFVKQIDANWAAGTDAGGFPSGLTLSMDTWYHYFAISGSGGVMDFGFDTSLTAANLLADATSFSYFRRIGSVLTDGTSNILQFDQYGDEFHWFSLIQDLDIENPANADRNLFTISVPPDISVMAMFYFDFADDAVALFSPFHEDVAANAVLGTGVGIGSPNNASGSLQFMRTDTSSQLAYRAQSTSSDFHLVTRGWIDPRGRSLT